MALSPEERTKIRHIKAERTLPKYRTFINIDNGHNKFWKIARLSHIVHTQYGAIDTDGVQVVKKLSSNQQAFDYVWNKINEKLNKGYEEI